MVGEELVVVVVEPSAEVVVEPSSVVVVVEEMTVVVDEPIVVVVVVGLPGSSAAARAGTGRTNSMTRTAESEGRGANLLLRANET